MGTNCTSEPLRASTGLSPGFALPRPRSLGFWSHGRDSGPFQTPPLAHKGCGLVGFPTPTGFTPLKLATAVNSPARVSRRKARLRSSPLVLSGRPDFLQGDSLLSSRATLSPPGFRLFSPPFRGTFQLSLTVLVRYRSRDVFSLGSWCLPASHGKIKPWYSGYRPTPSGLRLRGCHPLRRGFPTHFGFPS